MNETNILAPVLSEQITVLPGITLREALDKSLPVHLKNQPSLVVLNHGVEIKDIDNYYVQEGDRFLVGLLPAGGGGGGGNGKSIGQIIVGIVLIVVGVILSETGYGATLIKLGAGLLLSGVAGLLIKQPSLNTNNRQDLAQDRDSAYYGITGQSNSARAYQSVLKLYGRHKMFPALAANPNITSVGLQSYVDAVYDFGVGWVAIEDVRIGDTPAYIFQPDLRLHQNKQDPQLELANQKVTYDQFAYVLQPNQALNLRTNVNCWRAELSLHFTQGLVQFDSQGQPTAAAVEFDGWWRDVNSATWTRIKPEQVVGMSAYYSSVVTGYQRQTFEYNGWVYLIPPNPEFGDGAYDRYVMDGRQMGTTVPGVPLPIDNGTNGWNNPVLSRGAVQYDDGYSATFNLNVSADMPVYGNNGLFYIQDVSLKPKVASIQIQFPYAGEFEIQLTRTTAISSDTKLYNTATVAMLKSYVSGPMFNLVSPHTFLEMRLLASEKVSGVVQNLSAMCTSVLPRYGSDGTILAWEPTRNPAWIGIDILCGPCNATPVPLSMIDWPSWLRLADYCAQSRTWNINNVITTAARFTCDVVVDYKTTVKEMIESVLSGCRSALIITQTGKYGVLIDQTQSTPRQLITPSNSWDFSGNRHFAPQLHALRVGFIDSTRDYQRQEIMVYADGYDQSTAKNIEDAGTFGITDFYRAWAYGRYMLAQTVHRAEVFTIKMDIEHLAVQRGDLVHVQHDVPQIGGYSTRIVSVSGNVIEIAQELSTVPTAYSVRTQDGTVRQGTVVVAIDSTHFQLDMTSDLHPDDLLVIGIANRVTAPYIINTISPQNDFTAELTLSVYEPAIYDADIGVLPPWDPNWGDDIINQTDLAVTSVSPAAELVYVDRKPYAIITINFTVNSPFYGYADIFWLRPNHKPVLVDSVLELLSGRHEFSLVASIPMNYPELTYRVQPYTDAGLAGKPMDGTVATPVDPPPSAPPKFDLDLKRDTITLHWEHPNDPDILAYEVRYDPAIVDSSYSRATILTPSIPWPTRTYEVPARLGTYYIKSIDALYHRSDDFAVAFTPGETVWNLNVVGVVDDSPVDWSGIKSGFEVLSNGSLASTEDPANIFPFRSEYYYEDLFDNGQIYQTRLTSKIGAVPFNATSFMASWIPLAIATPIGGRGAAGGGLVVGDYMDVWHEVRWLDVSNVMADWVPLAVAVPIGYGDSAYGPWSKFQVGDYTGRVFQFRLIAEYIGPNSPPDAGVIIDLAKIEIDMHDRTDGEYNITCPAGGMRVSYLPAFKAIPALMITPDIVSVGDNYAITNKDTAGFDIEFFNSSGVSVTRNFDWLARGYGAESQRILNGLHSAPPRRPSGRRIALNLEG